MLKINAKINNYNGDKIFDIPISKFPEKNEEIHNDENYILMYNCDGKGMSVRGFICYGDPHNENVE